MGIRENKAGKRKLFLFTTLSCKIVLEIDKLV